MDSYLKYTQKSESTTGNLHFIAKKVLVRYFIP